MNLIQLNKIINELTLENSLTNIEPLRYYKAKRLELIERINTNIKIKLYGTN